MPSSKTVKDSFGKFAQLVQSDQGIEAIDLFYHDNIHQFENNNEPLIGKKLLRAKEEAVSHNMNLISALIQDVVIDEHEGKVWGRQIFIFENPDIGKKILDQAFMQLWAGDMIIEQRFYYAAVKDYE